MTTAVCLRCGNFKFGAWTACEHCGHIPPDTIDRLQHLLVSDHVAKAESLERISNGLRRGEKLGFDARDIRTGAEDEAASIAALIQAVENGAPPPPELAGMLNTVANFRLPAASEKEIPKAQEDLPSYYLNVNGETQGPYFWSEILSRLKLLPPDAMLWHPNTKEWRPFRAMPLI